MDIEGFIRPTEFMGLLGIKKSKFYTAISEGKIPTPTKISSRRRAWRESVVKDVLDRLQRGELML